MPVTDLAFAGRWPEERRIEAERHAVKQRDSKTPIVAAEEEKPASRAETAVAIEPLKQAVKAFNNRVDIQYRQDLEMVVMVVYRKDPETGEDTEEVVRQIPAEEALRLAQQLENGKATILDEIG